MKALGRQIRFVAVSASVSFVAPGGSSQQVPNIEDVARWLAAPPEEEEEVGFLAQGGHDHKTVENTFERKAAPEPPMAKVLKVDWNTDSRPLTAVRRRLQASPTEEDRPRVRSCQSMGLEPDPRQGAHAGAAKATRAG
jgi:hypothetical protein